MEDGATFGFVNFNSNRRLAMYYNPNSRNTNYPAILNNIFNESQLKHWVERYEVPNSVDMP